MEEKVKKIFKLFIFLSLVFVFHIYGFTFAVLGETRAGGKMVSPIFERIIEKIKEFNPDFIIHTGDWMDFPDREGWLNFLRIMKKEGVPFYLVVGNHETSSEWNKWTSLYHELVKKPLYYSFKYENSLFIILCCYIEKNGKTIPHILGKNQLKWLEEKLKEGMKNDFIFVFVHEPLFPVFRHIGASLDKNSEERNKIANLFRKYGKDKLFLFCGHEHLYNVKKLKGFTQIITGGGGAVLHAPYNKGGFFHFLIVNVENGKVKINVVKP